MALALVASGGVLAQRLSRGDMRTALAVQVMVTTAVLVLSRARIPHRACFVAQAIGAACGILVAHTALQASHFGALPWISERPAQYVNDAVAVFAPLAVVWACARRPPSTAIVAVTLGLVTAYRVTGFMWHLDAATFALPVQDLVARECACSALGVTLFRLFLG
ncbi:MAG TPA: hypothetical protein VIF62_25275 [Labilithrix sp.]